MLRCALSIAIALAGCGRIGFALHDPPDASDAGDARLQDAVRDVGATVPTCLPWQPGFSFTAPAIVTELNSSNDEEAPFPLSGDLAIYFSSARTGSFAIYYATRASTADPFSGITPVAAVNVETAETQMSITTDGTTAWLAAVGIGSNNSDIFTATRSGALDFTTPTRVAEVSDKTDNDYDPWISADQERLYFMRQPLGGNGVVMLASRGAVADGFGAPAPIAELESTGDDGNPTLSGDETLIVFVSTRAGGLGNSDLWFATRGAIGQPFSTPQLLPTLNTPSNDEEPFISANGCELYFSSDRAGGRGGDDIYRAFYVAPT